VVGDQAVVAEDVEEGLGRLGPAHRDRPVVAVAPQHLLLNPPAPSELLDVVTTDVLEVLVPSVDPLTDRAFVVALLVPIVLVHPMAPRNYMLRVFEIVLFIPEALPFILIVINVILELPMKVKVVWRVDID